MQDARFGMVGDGCAIISTKRRHTSLNHVLTVPVNAVFCILHPASSPTFTPQAEYRIRPQLLQRVNSPFLWILP